MHVFSSTRAQAASKRRQLAITQETGDLPYHKSEWMESGADPTLSPTIFLIEQPPNTVVEPHFHRQNQFQLFVGGGGRIGQETLQAVTVHYAGAYTGYGPLVAGENGIQYLTIRPVLDTGILFAREAREKMQRGPKRNATSAPLVAMSGAERIALGATRTVEAIPVGSDGVGARLLQLPPGAVAETPFPAAAQGAFVVLLAGQLEHAQGQMSAWESVFASSPDDLPRLTAGPEGAEAIFLFTPPRASAYS
ncbi:MULTISPECIES: hypothetical protein [unclassified Variovorax]|uniref:hypothetical protein n=1 Tax=unclassified Variovorax TaxID=663243 RepID=UPI00083868E8|nr:MULTISPECIES: hypothetical protein [unclassified Variovorax]PNG48780.1 hypothetical protein CHC06_06521 [Variovorax sp. B2]PNG49287.1 hypothetical protein CHC07_06169 [Variovorax sp. B4]VTV18442.1 hypothetical protein WDL1P2_00155 [Variovorax sp. WDL1]